MAQNPYLRIERGAPGTIGWRIHYFEEIDSTQNFARELAANDAAEGTVVIAEKQSAGRGRMGRTWHSPSGVNLYATIILRPTISLAEVSKLSLVAGVAAAEALEREAVGIVALKWPNDIWLRGRKAGGIIAEALSDSHQQLSSVLLGIGININLTVDDLPAELRDKATSLRIATGHACDRIAIAESLFSLLDSRYRETLSGGFESVRAAWERYSALTGKRVSILDGGLRKTGVVKGIDVDGALLLDIGENVERIVAGEVSVEGAYDDM
ncbi:MAG: biotin--[acetyl-CoA-carboxylase] ligase [Candidatus Binatus sp.]|uniref:biotin--[acetyl-CoA-carboxylase] ligase n=1 Tax=Candidatus Binatus sp. TaxID=2811406 RepID=UPI0027174A72|nr:biotin--[acetyl-CoA-carboxylase] ligase [Candidatus Binatus sp.]MDO8433181.1 biotin--[acetyl-CoA-carboxylase] ligase [Candidatus Binatus sp.]